MIYLFLYLYIQLKPLAKILGREGADSRTVVRFYVAVMQLVLIFGFETCVLTSRLGKTLEVLHHLSVRWRVRTYEGRPTSQRFS